MHAKAAALAAMLITSAALLTSCASLDSYTTQVLENVQEAATISKTESTDNIDNESGYEQAGTVSDSNMTEQVYKLSSNDLVFSTDSSITTVMKNFQSFTIIDSSGETYTMQGLTIKYGDSSISISDRQYGEIIGILQSYRYGYVAGGSTDDAGHTNIVSVDFNNIQYNTSDNNTSLVRELSRYIKALQ